MTGDGGDQQVLIHYFATTGEKVWELPLDFNAFGWDMVSDASEWWRKVRVLHKLRHVHTLTKAQLGMWGQTVPAVASAFLHAKVRTAMDQNKARQAT